MRDDTPSLLDVSGSAQTHGHFEPARLTRARVCPSVTKSDLVAEAGALLRRHWGLPDGPGQAHGRHSRVARHRRRGPPVRRY